MDWSSLSTLVPESKQHFDLRQKISSKRKILNYKTSRSFTEFFESYGVWDKLRYHLTHKFQATFLNGLKGEIEYNFNPARRREDRVLINIRNLSPLFGGIVPATTEEFTSIAKLDDFLQAHVHLNKCSYGVHASCACGQKSSEDVELFGSVCKYRHIHHFCSEHVRGWLHCYLHHAILLRESRKHYNELIAQKCALNPEDIIYLQTGDRATPEYWLNVALARGTILI